MTGTKTGPIKHCSGRRTDGTKRIQQVGQARSAQRDPGAERARMAVPEAERERLRRGPAPALTSSSAQRPRRLYRDLTRVVSFCRMAEWLKEHVFHRRLGIGPNCPRWVADKEVTDRFAIWGSRSGVCCIPDRRRDAYNTGHHPTGSRCGSGHSWLYSRYDC